MMWTSTCPQRTFVSGTIKDVSGTGGSFSNHVHLYVCVHTQMHVISLLPSPAAPIGSISSMEVNVDLLDQMELIDISDQEALDVFFSSGGEEGALTSPLPGMETGNKAEITRHTARFQA